MQGQLSRNEDGSFQHGDDTIGIGDPELALALERMSAAWPASVAVEDLLKGHMARGGLLNLFAEWYLELRHDPPQRATSLPERPRVSPLVLAGLRLDDLQVLTLDHTILAISQTELRKLLAACDGSRTLAELREVPHGFPPDEVEPALTKAVSLGLICR